MLVTNVIVVNRAAQTRERLRAAALRLFLEHGFDATTVNQVAAAAGVSHMTFFRYFPTKEDVVLDDPYDEVVVGAVLAQDRSLPALERVRRALVAAWAALPEPTEAETRARVRLIAGHRGLLGRSWENNRRTGELIAAALVEDGTDPLEAAVAAGACLAALMEALLLWGVSDDDRELGQLVLAALDQLAVEPAQATAVETDGAAR